jgi:hypothetical protein
VSIDYTAFSPGYPEKKASDPKDAGSNYARWWKMSGENADEKQKRASTLTAAAGYQRETQNERQHLNLLHARLYGNNDMIGFGVRDYTRSATSLGIGRSPRITLNVIASATDTLLAKIAKNKPTPRLMPSGGSWAIHRKCRMLEKFLRGLFYETKVYQHAKMQFLDACVFGTGALKIYKEQGGKLCVERAFVDELLVDDADGLYGTPRVLFQRKLVQKDVLADAYPEHALEISAMKPPNDTHPEKGFGDMVEVWEGWHLRSSENANDGVHMLVCGDLELYHEEWKHDFFPFAFFRFKRRVLGFWGQGVAEILTGIQMELNRLVRSVSEQLRRKGRGRIFVPIGSKVVPSHLTNNIADVVFFNGQPPVVDSGNAVAPEEFMQIDRLYQKAFQEVGASEMSVSAKKPSGLDAAVALREYSDIESERFATQSQDWDENFMNIADIMLALVKEDGGKGYKVKMPNRQYAIEIDWKDVNMARDSFVMQMFPASSLPQTPAARYQKVKEMQQDGFVDKPTAQLLLDLPDLEAENNLGNAAIEDADAVISQILDDEKPVLNPPEKYQNLELLLTRASAAYLYAKHHGAEEKRLNLMRQLIDRTAAMLTQSKNTPPPAPPMPAGPPAPGGQPIQAAPLISGGVQIGNQAPAPAPLVPPVTG